MGEDDKLTLAMCDYRATGAGDFEVSFDLDRGEVRAVIPAGVKAGLILSGRRIELHAGENAEKI